MGPSTLATVGRRPSSSLNSEKPLTTSHSVLKPFHRLHQVPGYRDSRTYPSEA